MKAEISIATQNGRTSNASGEPLTKASRYLPFSQEEGKQRIICEFMKESEILEIKVKDLESLIRNPRNPRT